MWELDCEGGWAPKNWCFWSVVLEKTLEQSILKEINPGISLEGMMLKLKLQYFGHLMWRVDSLENDSDAGSYWGQEEKGTTEDEMAGWHLGLDGRESEWTPGDGDGQGGLACCDSWGRKELNTTEQLNWTEPILVPVLQIKQLWPRKIKFPKFRELTGGKERIGDQYSFIQKLLRQGQGEISGMAFHHFVQ